MRTSDSTFSSSLGPSPSVATCFATTTSPPSGERNNTAAPCWPRPSSRTFSYAWNLDHAAAACVLSKTDGETGGVDALRINRSR